MPAGSTIRRPAAAPAAQPAHLTARLAAILGVDAAPVRIDPLELWPDEGQCLIDGERVELSRREFEVLMTLATCAGHVVPRARLHQLIWNETMRRGDRDVDVHVRKLRLKLLAAAPSWTFIHTHRQVGYRLWPERNDDR